MELRRRSVTSRGRIRPSGSGHRMYCAIRRRSVRVRRPRYLQWGNMMSTTKDPRSIPNRHSWRRAMVLLTVAGLAVAACGSDDDDSADDRRPPTPPPTTTTTDTAPTTRRPTPPPTTRQLGRRRRGDRRGTDRRADQDHDRDHARTPRGRPTRTSPTPPISMRTTSTPAAGSPGDRSRSPSATSSSTRPSPQPVPARRSTKGWCRSSDRSRSSPSRSCR